MEHPSSLIPAVWYNYSSYNDLLNRSRQLQPNVHTTHHAPQFSHMVAPPPAHSPVPDVSLQMAEVLPKPKKIRKPENYDGKERGFMCNQCPAAFYTQSKLNTHMRIHTGIKPYVCDECGKAFVQASNLKAHKRVHTGERPFPCDECGKSFRANSYLLVHKRIHSGEKPYICGFCNEGFYSSTYLANHIRVHTGEKPYVCDYCGEAYSQSLDLRMHKRIHTGDSPYKCWECNQAFISDKELTAHRKKSHKDSRPFRCEICRKKFRRPTFVAKHQAKCLGPAGTYSHTCALCGKGFRTETFCAKHQSRCKGPKLKKRIGRPPKYPRAEGEEGDRRRKRGTGKRKPKPIAATDRISRSRTKTVKEEIKEEPEAESEVKEENKDGIDINDLVKELGIEGFTKESLDEISNEVIQTIPKENITQELLKDLIEKKEQLRHITNASTTLTTQDLNGHQQQQLSHIITSQHLINEATHLTVSSNQTYSHQQQQQQEQEQEQQQQQQLVSENQPEMPGHQQAMLSHQQALSAQQQTVPIQLSATQPSIPHQLSQPMPDHHSNVDPAAQLAYDRALPYVVDLSGNPSNAYYSNS